MDHQDFNTGPSHLLYYHRRYLELSNFQDLKSFVSSQFQIHFSLLKNEAISVPQSPFGSYFTLQSRSSFAAFEIFESRVCKGLSSRNVRRLIVHHPAQIYGYAVPKAWMDARGYKKLEVNTNHHMQLEGKSFLSSIHPMEQRKLSKGKEIFEISEETVDSLPEIHAFVASCREEKGLEINITLARLALLFQTFPGQYRIFSARKNNELMAAVITVHPTADICYYYLPATRESAKKDSPMVALIGYLFEYYGRLQFRIIDLGLSSLHGKLQHGLASFKERMGALATERYTFAKEI